MNRLKELRTKLGMTQEELRQKFNNKYGRTYTAAAISQFENNKRTPETSALIDFADFFGVSIDCLLGRENIRNDIPTVTNELPKQQPKEYIELHRLIDNLPATDVEELLNTAIFKKKKLAGRKDHVNDPDDF